MRRTLALLGIAAIVTGCASPPPAEPPQIIEGLDAQLTQRELQARLVEYGNWLTGKVELTGRGILRDTDDPAIRRRAILWMVRINEEVATALSQRIPEATMIDLWLLATQLRNRALKIQAEDHSYGDMVLVVSEEMVAVIRDIAVEYGGEMVKADGQAIVDDWANQHPLQGDLSRVSSAPLVAKLLEPQERNLMSSLAQTADAIEDVAQRLEVLNNQLPRQIIWRAELLIEERLGSLNGEVLMAKLDDAMSLAEELPDIVAGERTVILADIDRQRVETLADIDRQRVEILADFDRQRWELQSDVDRQRIETLVALDTIIDGQREKVDEALARTTAEVLSSIDTQRVATIDALDEVVGRTAVGARGATELIDHLFWRALQLGAIAFVGVAVLLVLAIRVLPRRA